jgi:hypothetical protein
MKRIRPKQPLLRPDGVPMSEDDFRELHNQLADFDSFEWIDDETREIVERFMPDLVDRLPERTSETFDQAFGKMRAAAARKPAKRRKPQRIDRGSL